VLLGVEVQDEDRSVLHSGKVKASFNYFRQNDQILIYKMQMNLACLQIVMVAIDFIGSKTRKKYGFHFISPVDDLSLLH
jgi:hypothetical protein